MGINDLKEGPFEKIVGTLIPGGIAISSWIVGLIRSSQESVEFVNKHETLVTLLVILMAVAAGMVIEEIGYLIEERIEKCRKSYVENCRNWERYLKTVFPTEPIGHRYLRSRILRMRFQLRLPSAIVAFWVGVFVYRGNLGPITFDNLVFPFFFSLFLIAFLHSTAKDSSVVLEAVRKMLIEDGLLDPKRSDPEGKHSIWIEDVENRENKPVLLCGNEEVAHLTPPPVPG